MSNPNSCYCYGNEKVDWIGNVQPGEVWRRLGELRYRICIGRWDAKMAYVLQGRVLEVDGLTSDCDDEVMVIHHDNDDDGN